MQPVLKAFGNWRSTQNDPLTCLKLQDELEVISQEEGIEENK